MQSLSINVNNYGDRDMSTLFRGKEVKVKLSIQ